MTATHNNRSGGWLGALAAAAIPCALGGVVLAGPAAADAAPFPPADAYAYDSFTAGDGTGTAGASIAGTQLEGGGIAWTENADGELWQFNSAGEAVVNVTQKSAGDIQAALPDVEGQVVTIEALLDPVNSAYLVISLSKGLNLFSDSLFFRLNPGGGYALLFRGHNDNANDPDDHEIPHKTLTTGSITRDGLEALVLSYDLSDNTVSASINGAAILTDYDLVANGVDVSSINGAGGRIDRGVLRFQNVTVSGTDRADDFAISIVPEPGSLSLLALGGLMCLRRRHGAGRP